MVAFIGNKNPIVKGNERQRLCVAFYASCGFQEVSDQDYSLHPELQLLVEAKPKDIFMVNKVHSQAVRILPDGRGMEFDLI